MRREVITILAYDAGSKLIIAVPTLALIRFLSPAEYAHYTVAIAVATLIADTLVTTFSRVYIVGQQRFLASGNAGPFLGLQLLVISTAAVLGGLACGFGIGSVAAVAGLATALCVSDFLKTDYQRSCSFHRYSWVVLARSVFFALGVCGLLALLRDGTPAWAALCAQAAAGLLSSVPLVFRPDRWRGAHRLLDGLKTGRDILASQYRYLFAYFFVVAFFSQMDILLLRAWSDPGQLATYGSAFRYYTFLVLSLNAVHTVMLPRLQEVTERSAMRTLLRKQWALAALFLPVVIGLALAAPWFIPWIDGGKYPEAPRVFRILAASSAISFCFSPFVNVVLRLERFFPLLLWAGVALVLDVALNAVLIPRHGAPGAAWATLAAFAFMNIVVFLVARRLLAAGPEPGPGKDSPEGTRP